MGPALALELISGSWVLCPHCREHYRTTQVPVAYDANADAPRFRAFLNQVFEGDSDREDKIRAVLELFGYTLMSHTRHEFFFILIGEGENGKSRLLNVLEDLCGSINVAGVQPSNFDNKFQRAALDQKLANIVTEIKQGEILADAELKGITSGEATTVEHKFKDPFLMHPFSVHPCKAFIFCTTHERLLLAAASLHPILTRTFALQNLTVIPCSLQNFPCYPKIIPC